MGYIIASAISIIITIVFVIIIHSFRNEIKNFFFEEDSTEKSEKKSLTKEDKELELLEHKINESIIKKKLFKIIYIILLINMFLGIIGTIVVSVITFNIFL